MAKKRAMEAIQSQLQPAKKNRVVLGELSNNATVSTNNKIGSDMAKIQKPKKKVKKAVKAALEEQELILEKIEKLSDPQMCETYVADIYEYLHDMEVRSFSSIWVFL